MWRRVRSWWRLRRPNFDLGWKKRVKELKTEIVALYLAYKDPRVPWYAKAFIVVIVGYALSPVDLIPDFIPVLGYVDDFILIPAAITVALKMIPPDILEECRKKAASESLKKNWVGAVFIVLIWVAALYLGMRVVCSFLD